MTVTSDQLGTYPAPTHDAEELALLSRLRNTYQRARSAKRLLYADWRRNWLLVNNRMWSQVRLSSWMPTPQDNELYPIVAGLIGWMTDQNVSFSVNPAALPGTPWAQYLEKLSDDLESLLQSNWKVLNWQSVITEIMWDAALYGAGIGKAVWDQSLEQGEGNADIVRVDPWNFYPDPNANDEKEAGYFYEVRRLSWDEVERRFPETAPRLLEDLVWEASDNSLDSDSRPTNSRQGSNANSIPMSMSAGYPTVQTSSMGLPGQGRFHAWMPDGIILYEAWMKENRDTEIPDPDWKAPEANPDAEAPKVKVVYDDWRVVVYSSNTILLDCWASDLWSGATHPYSRFYFEDPGEFWPTPLVSQMAPMQIAINRLLAAMQQSAELTGNPIFIESTNSGMSNSLIVNRPGQRLKVNPTGGQNPQWLSPPLMSGDVMSLVRYYIDRMENISGLSTTSKGKAPTPRTPEAVVNQVQESGFVRVRQGLRNLEKMLRKLGEITSQLIVENYTQQKIVSILGPDGGQSAVFLQNRHFIDAVNDEFMPFKYALIINAGSDMPTSRQARMAEAQTLFVLKAIDRPALLEAAEYPHWQDIEARMEQKEQAEAQAQQELTARQKTGRKS
jgi:hypothetical protein